MLGCPLFAKIISVNKKVLMHASGCEHGGGLRHQPKLFDVGVALAFGAMATFCKSMIFPYPPSCWP
jgi:TctA family transporter